MHRLGLSETILLFAEHRQFLVQSPEALLHSLQLRAPEQRRVVEVHDLADAKRWAQAGAEVLQMDKLPRNRCVSVPTIAASRGCQWFWPRRGASPWPMPVTMFQPEPACWSPPRPIMPSRWMCR